MFQNLFRAVFAVALISLPALAQQARVNVTVENVAPNNGTFQTPVWVGFHNGSFDTYDGGTLASSLPIPGSDALERLAEDGSTGPISLDFSTLNFGTHQATIAGPNGPIAPGDKATMTFLLDSNNPNDRYFSYASMVIPSNDAFVANGNPLAHPIFDGNGNIVASDFFVAGQNAVNDAGTEVNDEVPGNTAFFGQAAPNTGVTEGSVITTHPGFLANGSGGILDTPRFRDGDFTVPGYPFLRFGFRVAPAVTAFRFYGSLLSGAEEVPAVVSPSTALSGLALIEPGETLVVTVATLGLENLIFGHLHLGVQGVNGPVVATVIPNQGAGSGGGGFEVYTMQIKAVDLQGPLAGFPLDELARRLENGEIYVNLHTDDGVGAANSGPGDFLSGELRGQAFRLF